jgi:ABC-type polysaccharide/polyol phosphate export permease
MMKIALLDFFSSLRSWRILVFMAMSDLKARYKRTALGPLWITLGSLVGVMGLGFIWSELMKADKTTFIPMLTTGLITWQFISGAITESCSIYTRQAAIVRNLQLPMSIHPCQLLLRHLLNFAHNLPVLLVVMLLLNIPLTWSHLYVLPALILTSLNLLWMMVIISILGARFKDLEYTITMVLPLLMFFSPVFYRPNHLPNFANLIWLNPFSHLIELMRSPFLGMAPDLFVIKTNLIMLVIGWAITLWLFGKKSHRIVFWV